MKSYSSKFALNSVAFGLAMAATFIACGDENTTKVNESTGLDVIAKGDTLPQCGSDNAGDMVFVTDSSAVYYCADEKWSMLNGKDGEQGDKGGQGEPGDAGDSGKDGDEGTSCTAKIVEAGIEVTCGDTVIGTIKNGDTGDAIEGKKGNSCSATQDEKTKNVTITCETDDGKGVTYTVVNGTDGKSAYELSGSELTLKEWLASFKGETGKNCTIANYENTEKGESGYKITCGKDEKIVLNGTGANPGVGCSLDESEGNGVVKVICGEGENESTAILYKAVCGTENYDPETQFCVDGVRYEMCDGEVYDVVKSKCVDYRIVTLTLGKITDSRDAENVQEYNTVTIEISYKTKDGDGVETKHLYKETWMAENLNYVVNDGEQSWCYGQGQEGVTEAVYKGNCETYGRLYTWAAAVGKTEDECGPEKECLLSDKVQGACPNDWHLPSNDEWNALFAAIGGKDKAGIKLRSKSELWASGGTDNTDDFGFAALPAGTRGGDGVYYTVTYNVDFWGSTAVNNDEAYEWGFYYSDGGVEQFETTKDAGFSIRCLKD